MIKQSVCVIVLAVVVFQDIVECHDTVELPQCFPHVSSYTFSDLCIIYNWYAMCGLRCFRCFRYFYVADVVIVVGFAVVVIHLTRLKTILRSASAASGRFLCVRALALRQDVSCASGRNCCSLCCVKGEVVTWFTL